MVITVLQLQPFHPVYDLGLAEAAPCLIHVNVALGGWIGSLKSQSQEFRERYVILLLLERK